MLHVTSSIARYRLNYLTSDYLTTSELELKNEDVHDDIAGLVCPERA